MSPTMLVSQLDRDIEAFLPEMIDLSDWMAANPELSGEEVEATARIIRILRESGFSVDEKLLGLKTAFRARIGAGEPRVALLVECDALPEIGHACGHCLSASMSILTALSLAPLLEKTEGTLEVIGTPAEETDGAKCLLAERGVFDGLALATMIHASGSGNMAAFRSLALDGYHFTFNGKSAHAAAAPWEGRSALSALELFFHALALLRQEIRPDARIHGIIRDGGTATNVIPEKTSCLVEFRASTRQHLNEIVGRALKCARAASLVTETDVSWKTFMASFDDMNPNPAGERRIEEIFRELGIPFEASGQPSGSTDVGNVSHRCPALQPMLEVTSHGYALHTRDFADIVTEQEAHQALRTGGRILGRLLLQTLGDRDLREDMAASIQKNTPGPCINSPFHCRNGD